MAVATLVLFIVLSLVVVLAFVVFIGQRRFKRRVANEVRLLRLAPPSVFPMVAVELPAPVARY